MANTAKGKDILQSLQKVDLLEVPINYTEQPHLAHPVLKPKDNNEFWAYLDQYGFQKMTVKYLKAGKIRRIISKILRTGIKLIK